MTNYKGLNTGHIISDKVFTKLIQNAINRLLAPCIECLNKILSELKDLSCKIKFEEMNILENARKAILSEMEKVIISCYQPTENMIISLIKVESGYININNPIFESEKSECMRNFFHNLQYRRLF